MVSENSKFFTACGFSLKLKSKPERTVNYAENQEINIEQTSSAANGSNLNSILTVNGVRKMAMIPPSIIQSAFTV